MSEDVIQKLSRFSPKGVDRDAMLFAVGRASAKSSRFWKFAALGLLFSHAVLFAMWIREPKVEPPKLSVPAASPVVSPVASPDDTVLPEIDPYSLLALSRNPDHPPSSVSQSSISPRPPLMASTRNYQP